jgi:CheY-like chemotaxis protein
VDGLDALERVRAGPPPCVIVLDSDMPRMSGPDLLAALRGDATIPRIPVVTMTAGNDPPSAHADRHLAKPFRAETLLATLYAVCRSCAACDEGGPVVGSIYCARRRADASLPST